MTKLEFIQIGFDANILSFATGNKLGAIRHLRKLFADAQALLKEREGIKELTAKPTDPELKAAIEEFNNEEYTAGVAVIPAEWFDNVSADPFELEMEGGQKQMFSPYPFLERLIKNGVVK